jgi:hypothetical protein
MPKPLKPGQISVSLDYKDAPPRNSIDARTWIQEAIRDDRYTPSHHLFDRLRERELSMNDLVHAILHSRKVEPYPDMPRHGGTCWRLFGPDLELQKELGVGIEAYLNEHRRWIVLCTLFAVKERSWT